MSNLEDLLVGVLALLRKRQIAQLARRACVRYARLRRVDGVERAATAALVFSIRRAATTAPTRMNWPKIEEETTHDLVWWRRFTKTASTHD